MVPAEAPADATMLTTEELVLLCAGLGLTPPSDYAVPPGEIDGDALRRGLIAHRLVGVINGRAAVSDGLAELLTVICRPALLVHVERRLGDLLVTCDFSATPTVGVHQEHSPVGVHALRSFPTGELYARILGYVDVPERPEAVSEPFTVSVGELDEATVTASTGASRDANAVLEEAGVSKASAEAFVEAARGSMSMNTVGSLYRREADWFKSVVSWIDGGDAGLWALTARGEDVAVAPTTATALTGALRAILP